MFGTRSSSFLLLQLDVGLGYRKHRPSAHTLHSRKKTTIHECQSQCEFKKNLLLLLLLFPKSVAVWFAENRFKMLNSLTSVWNRSEYLETPQPTVTHRTTRIFNTHLVLYRATTAVGEFFPLSMFGTRSRSFLLFQLDVGLGLDKTSPFMLVPYFQGRRQPSTNASHNVNLKKCRELFIKSNRNILK